MKNMCLILIASLLASAAQAQIRSERPRELRMQPGESYIVLDPRTNERLRVSCEDGFNDDRATVEYYYSDSCNGQLITISRPHQDCRSLNASSRVWGIKVNNRCIDIKDTDVVNACFRFKAAGSRQATTLYYSDSCNGNAVAVVNRNTDCGTLGTDRVWGIRRADGTCVDIQDMDVRDACERFK